MASIWMRKNEGREKLLEDVAQIRFEKDWLVLSTLLGENKQIHASIEEINFIDSEVVLREPAEG